MFEPRNQLGIDGVGTDDLDRDVALEGAIGAPGQIHAAHAAGADEPDDLIGADAAAEKGVATRRRGRRVNRVVVFDLLIQLEQLSDFVEQGEVVAARLAKVKLTLVGRLGQGRMKQVTNATREVRAHDALRRCV